jgi:hypothetical protein
MNNMATSACLNIEVLSIDYRSNLYKLHQQNQISAYIFAVENLDKETLQFIDDYYRSVKFFIYHRNINTSIINAATKCAHLVHEKNIEALSTSASIISIPKLLNTNVFIRPDTKHNNKKNDIVCFMDQVAGIPERLQNLLYPNSKLNIKMYNGTQAHAQNLGLASEYDKFHILSRSQSYLSLDGLYDQEARICDCDVFTTESLRVNKNINNSIDMNYMGYTEFLKDILIN